MFHPAAASSYVQSCKSVGMNQFFFAKNLVTPKQNSIAQLHDPLVYERIVELMPLI